jgi:hypothetical protein
MAKNNKIVNKKSIFENRYFSLEIKDGILHIDYKDNLVITLPIAKEMVSDRIKFQEQEKYEIIPAIGTLNIKYANKKAREYLGTEGIKGLTAAAFVAKGLVTKTLLQIFMTVEKPSIPICVFENENEAIEWIEKQVSA